MSVSLIFGQAHLVARRTRHGVVDIPFSPNMLADRTYFTP